MPTEPGTTSTKAAGANAAALRSVRRPPSLPITRVALLATFGLVVSAAVGRFVMHALRPDGQAPMVNEPVLCLAAALWSAGIAAQGPRWNALLPPGGGVRRTLYSGLAVLGANALTVTVPGPSGEALLTAFCARDFGVPWATGGAAIFLARLLGLGLLGAGALAGVGLVPGGSAWAPAAGFALGLGGLLVSTYLVAGRGLRGAVATVGGWLPAHLWRRIGPAVVGVVDQVLTPGAQPVRTWLTATAWSLVSTVLMAAGGYCSAVAVGVAPSPAIYLWMHAVSAVAGLVAMVIPAGIGPLDALWVGLYVAVRASGESEGEALQQGVIAAVAWRQMQALSLLISLGPLAWVGRRAAQPSAAQST